MSGEVDHTPLTPGQTTEVERLVARFRAERGALLPLLHAIRDELGYVPDAAVPLVADGLNVSRADVHGVLTFYHDFRRAPAGKHVVKLCRAEACQARGGKRVQQEIEQALGLLTGDTKPEVTLEPVYCVGLCASGPAALVDGVPVGGVTADRLVALLAPDKLDDEAAGRVPVTSGADGQPLPATAAPTQAAARVFISDDMNSVALGADALADAFAAAGCDVRRTSSHGLWSIEPLVEVETPEGRVGYGPVGPADVAAVLDGSHASKLGDVRALPFFAGQQRFTFARAGITEPLSLADYEAHGGWAGLRRARAMAPADVVAEVKASGLRGRGGAGFPTGIKWQTVLDAAGPEKFIVVNADEGDSGTFADRMVMEGDPFLLIEGMAIAAHAVGATYGYIYCRSEYPFAIRKLNEAIRRSAGLVAPFALEVRVGAGAYVCGEETALLDSIEGKRGQVRAKPPLPAHVGLFGKPTVINNVLSLAAVPFILSEGAKAYADVGFGRSRGTMPIQLAGCVKHGGLYEVGFGITLGELVNDIGGGTASGRPVKAVQVGGPLGAYFPPAMFGMAFDYETFAQNGGLIGHAGITVFDDTVDMAGMARFAMEFCATESCGKCTPCRIGSTRGVELMDRIIEQGGATERPTIAAFPQLRQAKPGRRNLGQEVELLRDLCDTMKHGSLCALGGFTPYPVLSALDFFPEDFGLTRTAEAAE